jgi:CRP/FNR family transcriptional regulator, cyclic AMP receptor protein
MNSGNGLDAKALIHTYGHEWSATSFLARIGPSTLNALVGGRTLIPFDNGERLIVEGENDHAVFLLVSGRVKATADLGGGKMAMLAIRVPGDIVGEIAPADDGVRSATVTSTVNGTLAVQVPGERFLSVVNGDPESARLLQSTLTAKLRSSNQRRIDINAFKVVVRVARVLAELAELCGRPGAHHNEVRIVAMGFSRPELATMVGAKVTAVAEALAELRQQGILVWGYRGVTINDVPALRAFAQLPP